MIRAWINSSPTELLTQYGNNSAHTSCEISTAYTGTIGVYQGVEMHFEILFIRHII